MIKFKQLINLRTYCFLLYAGNQGFIIQRPGFMGMSGFTTLLSKALFSACMKKISMLIVLKTVLFHFVVFLPKVTCSFMLKENMNVLHIIEQI